MKKRLFGFTVYDMVEISMFVAMAVLLDRFIRIPVGMTGGSVNIATLLLFIIALRHGPFKGFLSAGIVFGLITCLADGYGVQTYPLEYLLAFGVIGTLGFFGNTINKVYNNSEKGKLISYLIIIAVAALCFVVRLFAATIDSIILWDYTFGAAIIYNISYIGVSSLIVLALLLLFLPILIRLNKDYKSSYLVEDIDNDDIE